MQTREKWACENCGKETVLLITWARVVLEQPGQSGRSTLSATCTCQHPGPTFGKPGWEIKAAFVAAWEEQKKS